MKTAVIIMIALIILAVFGIALFLIGLIQYFCIIDGEDNNKCEE